MSHLNSSTVHSTKAFTAGNVSPLHQSGSTTMKIAPVSVLVNWSESNRFESGLEMGFVAFESLALEAALQNPLGGYDKTDITVTFDNGHQHRCRVDLGCGGNETGFADHCFRILEHAQALETSEPNHWYFTHANGKELLALVRGYAFNRQHVAQARSQVLAATRLAKEQQEIEKQAQQAAKREKMEQERTKLACFREQLVVPEWAQAVIVASFTVYDEEQSDPYGDYYQYRTEKTIILAWSKHQRRLFPELRKACLNHPETEFLANVANSAEHRENYSMGAGTYLTDKDYIRCGWQVRKVRFWSTDNKSQYVPLGELAANLG
ncbi:hypothetical protein Q6U64_004246 [Vibrio vulnificus]|nr:hypothetical protein [Vibrio vulnificus]